jgi:choline kinase
MSWIDEFRAEKNVGKKIFIEPSDKCLDRVNIFDSDHIIAEDIFQDAANELVVIWNSMIDNGENPRTINLGWLTGIDPVKLQIRS